jgi:hypothetical protein
MHKCTCCWSGVAHNVRLLTIPFTVCHISTMMYSFTYHNLEFMPLHGHTVQDSDRLSKVGISFSILATLMHKCTCWWSAVAQNVRLLAILFTAWHNCAIMCSLTYHTDEFMSSCDHTVRDRDILSQVRIAFNILANCCTSAHADDLKFAWRSSGSHTVYCMAHLSHDVLFRVYAKDGMYSTALYVQCCRIHAIVRPYCSKNCHNVAILCHVDDSGHFQNMLWYNLTACYHCVTHC